MDTQRAINCLLPVLKWFKSTFSILADSGLEQVDVDTLLGPLSRTLHKQVCAPMQPCKRGANGSDGRQSKARGAAGMWPVFLPPWRAHMAHTCG